MERLGILGGTFDPPHLGHLWAAQTVIEDYKLDRVWLVPCYTASFYGKTPSLGDHRVNMCIEAVMDFNNGLPIMYNNLEIAYKFKYTYQTVEYLSRCFDVYLIVGSDWNLTKFKNYSEIQNLAKIIHILRPGYGEARGLSFQLSSSLIRKRVQKRLSIRGLVTPNVEKYIREQGLYAIRRT